MYDEVHLRSDTCKLVIGALETEAFRRYTGRSEKKEACDALLAAFNPNPQQKPPEQPLHHHTSAKVSKGSNMVCLES